ncbi:MAG: phasin family protein [candidate division SR1 bacterium]|nr:phasin family protein [candidate division SR1 bacterium]
MAKITLYLIIIISIVSACNLTTYYSINLFAADISSEDIQAAQRLANESTQQAKKMAEQSTPQSDQANFQIEQAKNLANQAIAQAKQVSEEASKAVNNASVKNGVIANCTTVSTNIETQITKFNDGKNPRVEKFQIIASSVAELIKKLKEEKVDIKNLESSLIILNKKLKNYILVQDSYVSGITSTKFTTCTKSENEFKSSLQDSQNKLKIVKDVAKDLQDYVQKNVRQEIQKIKDQTKN